MELPSLINSLGLAFDILGVILLFFYEPPKETYGILLESAPSEEQRNKTYKSKRRWSKWGLISLIFGFLLQIISNFM